MAWWRKMQIVQCYRPVCRERWAFYVVIKRHFFTFIYNVDGTGCCSIKHDGRLSWSWNFSWRRSRAYFFSLIMLFVGARGHGQGGHLPLPSLHWKYCKVFCALVVTVKRSEDEIFMHHFHNLSSASRGFTGDPSLDPAAKLSSPDP